MPRHNVSLWWEEICQRVWSQQATIYFRHHWWDRDNQGYVDIGSPVDILLKRTLLAIGLTLRVHPSLLIQGFIQASSLESFLLRRVFESWVFRRIPGNPTNTASMLCWVVLECIRMMQYNLYIPNASSIHYEEDKALHKHNDQFALAEHQTEPDAIRVIQKWIR